MITHGFQAVTTITTGQGRTETEDSNATTTATNDDEPSLILRADKEISLETLGFMQVIIF